MEVQIEKIIEKPITIEEVVEVPVERVVDEIVETIVDNPIYHDNIQEVDIRDINRYQWDEILDKEVRYQEQEVEVQQHVYYENIIEQEV